MAGGVAGLGEDADLLDAFRVANRAVARALRRRLGDPIGPDGPRRRPFQLAFLLLNLPGLADPRDPHRETVDPLFFPTGGGKTESYLGLAAVAMVLRRLRHPGDEGLAGAGVGVIMRCTLRLLTLDQLARAAGLVCALEMERSEAGGRYGSWPFEIAGPLGTMAGLYETAIEALAVREVDGRVVKPKRSAPLKAYAREAEARTPSTSSTATWSRSRGGFERSTRCRRSGSSRSPRVSLAGDQLTPSTLSPACCLECGLWYDSVDGNPWRCLYVQRA